MHRIACRTRRLPVQPPLRRPARSSRYWRLNPRADYRAFNVATNRVRQLVEDHWPDICRVAGDAPQQSGDRASEVSRALQRAGADRRRILLQLNRKEARHRSTLLHALTFSWRVERARFLPLLPKTSPQEPREGPSMGEARLRCRVTTWISVATAFCELCALQV